MTRKQEEIIRAYKELEDDDMSTEMLFALVCDRCDVEADEVAIALATMED